MIIPDATMVKTVRRVKGCPVAVSRDTNMKHSASHNNPMQENRIKSETFIRKCFFKGCFRNSKCKFNENRRINIGSRLKIVALFDSSGVLGDEFLPTAATFFDLGPG